MKRITKMKGIAFASCCALLVFSSCSKSEDLYEGGTNEPKKAEQPSDEQIAQNVKDVFGTDFSPNQDWSMVRNSEITITPDAPDFETVKVQVLTGFPSKYGTAEILNEADAAGKPVAISFDAPDGVDTLYAACVNKDGQYRAKAFVIGEKAISFAETATSRMTRVTRAGESDTPSIVGEGVISDNAKKLGEGDSRWAGSYWDDLLYDTKLKCEAVSNFSNTERQTMNDIIKANVPEYSNNTARIKASDIYINTSNYFTATGQREIQITPVACGAWFCGWESLYYYYFDPNILIGKSEEQRKEFLQKLPKFKIADVAETFANQNLATVEEKIQDSRNRYNNMLNRIDRHYTYTLAYFGDGDNLTQQTTAFPPGYQIGIMLRIDSLQDVTNVYNCVNKNISSGEKVGGVNLYSDRLLNSEINYYAAWRNANLGKDMSRTAIFGANGKNYVGFEDLYDDDFNDVVFEVTGGVEIIDEKLLLDRKVYTMAFEDTYLGDYDMNDVVIKAQRIDLTHVKFSLEATGAKDELYLRNIKGSKLNTTTEIHAMFGQTGGRNFVNTEANKAHANPVQEIIEVPVGFTFAEDKYLPWIYNATKEYEVKISRRGEDPHGIIIPWDFQYPYERICVGGDEEKAAANKVAFKRFNSWGRGNVDGNDWYKNPTDGLVYKQSVMVTE